MRNWTLILALLSLNFEKSLSKLVFCRKCGNKLELRAPAKWKSYWNTMPMMKRSYKLGNWYSPEEPVVNYRRSPALEDYGFAYEPEDIIYDNFDLVKRNYGEPLVGMGKFRLTKTGHKAARNDKNTFAKFRTPMTEKLWYSPDTDNGNEGYDNGIRYLKRGVIIDNGDDVAKEFFPLFKRGMYFQKPRRVRKNYGLLRLSG